MEKKYQIFISSTYTDLIEERKKVRDTILSMLHFPVGMEIFGAADEEQWEIIKDTIDSSDYYVLLVAHRYGSIIESGPDAGISYTEKEYRYAKEKGIPILAFLIDDSVPVLPEKMERDNPEKLKAFKQEVKTGRLVEWWKNADDLAQKLSISLHKQMDRKKRPGWVRADSFDIEQSHAELLALNKQIRELQDENKKLKNELEIYYRQKIDRVPKLAVTLNVDTFDDEFDVKCHPEYAIQDKNALLCGIKICNMSVHDIDSYSTEGYVRINIGIHNDGTVKASNVFAKIEFPEGVIVYNDILFALEETLTPEVKKNLIELERKRQKKLDMDLWKKTWLNSLAYDFNSETDIVGMSSETQSDCKTYNQIIGFDCGTIIHTMSHWERGIYLVGKTPGKYQIRCTLMCEEYIEPQVEYIDFVVE